MNEIEIKILEINVPNIENKLLALGARKIFEGQLFAQHFKNSLLREKKELLRLRKEGESVALTHKKIIHGTTAKAYLETEITVSDFDKTQVLLESIGLEPTKKNEKKRISYRLDAVRFDIDIYSGEYGIIPPFLEIESEDENLVYAYAEKLGFSKEECKSWTGSETYAYYKKLLKKTN